MTKVVVITVQGQAPTIYVPAEWPASAREASIVKGFEIICTRYRPPVALELNWQALVEEIRGEPVAVNVA